MAHKLVVLPKPEPKSEAEMVAQEFLREAPKTNEVVILYRTTDGNVNIITNQGDAAGALYFVEQAKLRILERGMAIPQSAS